MTTREMICEGRCNGVLVDQVDDELARLGRDYLGRVPVSERYLALVRRLVHTPHRGGHQWTCLECGAKRL